jgi:hypothetical protein
VAGLSARLPQGGIDIESGAEKQNLLGLRSFSLLCGNTFP